MNPDSRTQHTEVSSKPTKNTNYIKLFLITLLAVIAGAPIAAALTLFVLGIGIIILFVILGALFSGGGTEQSPLSMTTIYGQETAIHTIAVVEVNGIILSGSSASPSLSFFSNYADGDVVKSQLRTLAEDSSISGVILQIDSPGGMITATKAIADGVAYFRDITQKPIVAHINGSGASGGYWAAASADKIYAEQGSTIGSIGVLYGPLVRYKDIINDGSVTTREPITYKYFTSGTSKDLGSPFRDITQEEESFIQDKSNLEYNRFVEYVSSRRSIPKDTITQTLGALTFTTEQAQDNKLIDGEYSLEQTIASVAQSLDLLPQDYKVNRVESSPSLFGGLFGVESLLSSITDVVQNNQDVNMSEFAASRERFCSQYLFNQPLVFYGDLLTVCN